MPRGSRRLPAICLTLLAGVLTLTGVNVAQAQPGWVLPASTLSAPTASVYGPVVAVDARGDASELFTQEEAGVDDLLSVDHPPGGPWSSPTSLAHGELPQAPAIAMNAGGDIVAAWLDRSAGPASPLRVWVSERPASGSWGPSVELSAPGNPTDVIPFAPVLAIDDTGDAVVVWVQSTDTYSEEWLVGSYRHGGRWGPPVRISTPAERIRFFGGQSAIVVNGAGTFLVVWTQHNEGGISSAEAQEMQGGVFDGEQILESTPDELFGGAVSENAAGRAGAIWVDENTEQAHAATFFNGAWTINNPGASVRTICDQGPPRIAVDGGGVSTALWLEESGQLNSSQLSPSGVWGAHEPIATVSGYVGELGLAVDPAGDLLADWNRDSYNEQLFRFESMVEASSRLAGRDWGEPVALNGAPGEDNSGASLAIDPHGNGLAGFSNRLQGRSPAYAAGFEMGPLIRSESVPVTLKVAEQGTFTAQALAPWATVASTHWDFGDGTGADGASATHAYANPRTYTVIVTVTDSLGNTTSESRQVTVGQPPSTQASRTAAPQALGPVYLIVSRQRFWLRRKGHVTHARIRNTNPFAVTGTATMVAHFLAHGAHSASAASRPIAKIVHFSLPANTTAPISFQVSKATLRRLRANVPDRGHLLISVHLKINGAGQSASSVGIYVLDQHVPRLHVRHAHASPGYSNPADPWAHSAC